MDELKEVKKSQQLAASGQLQNSQYTDSDTLNTCPHTE